MVGSKITIGGHFMLIAPRAEAGKSLPPLTDGFSPQAGRITRRSSSEAQPWVAATFNENGAFVSGVTFSETDRRAVLAQAKKVCATIEEEVVQ